MAVKQKGNFVKILFYFLLIFGAFIAIVPFLYLISNSLKTYAETVTRVSANPFSPRFWTRKLLYTEIQRIVGESGFDGYLRSLTENYKIVITEEKIGMYFWNSVVIAIVTVGGILLTSTLAAYGFSKLRFRGKSLIFTIMLATLMIPETVLLIPNYLIISNFGWLDRLAALTVPFMGSAFFIFLLRQFFNQIPDAIIESALMDGYHHIQILPAIVVPLMRAPLFTVFFLAFTGSWNALQWPLVVTQSDKWRPIAVGITKFITEAGPETQLRMSASVIALIPAVFIFLVAQKQITEAIANTGLKG